MKVMVVDDSSFMRITMQNLLEKAGYEVETAEDGLNALRKLALSKGDIDLITLDVEMPKMTGFEACEKIREEKFATLLKRKDGRNIPIVFCTSCDTMKDRKRGFDLGATDFINKKLLESEYIPTIDKILKPSSKFKNLTALVVEDSAHYRYLIKELFERDGMKVVEAKDGLIAYNLLRKNPEDFDFIIADLIMPNMGGLELIKKVRTELGLKDIPIIALSGLEDNYDITLDIFESGADDFIKKPFLKEIFMSRAHSHIERALHAKTIKNNLKKLKEAQIEIEEINQEREELLHILCHDLSNPFNAMISCLDLLSVSPDILEELLPELKKTVDNGVAVINSVREMRALDAGKTDVKLGAFNLKEIIEESHLLLKNRFESKNIHLEIDIDKNITVLVDLIPFINSVINNLFTNAIKFSERDSKLTVKAITIENKIKLSIIDYGMGIPKNLLNDLFNVKKCTTRPGTEGEAGTGFGMPLVKKFVESFGGKLQIESKDIKEFPENHGTEIIIILNKG